jgi:class III poly(R)-hydroxyalkanoic acid synthase PhaE subunit
MNATREDMSELLTLYEQLQDLGLRWLQSLSQSPSALRGDSSELSRITDVYWDGYERTLGRVVNAPGLGYTRRLSEKLLEGFDAWLELVRAGFEYQVLVAGAWARVPERFMSELISLPDEGRPIESLQQLLYAWLEVGDRVFLEEFRSDEYLQAQSGLLSKAMSYRLRERDIVEDFLRLNHLPTQTEVDEIHRTVYELRKELRAVKKRLRDGQPEGRDETSAKSLPKATGPRDEA